MVKRKTQKLYTQTSAKFGAPLGDTIDELVLDVTLCSEAVQSTEDIISTEIKHTLDGPLDGPLENSDSNRNELIKASEDGYITQKAEYLKKCSNKVIDKIQKQFEVQRKRDADAFLTDIVISQFASMLGGLDAIEDPKSLTDELKGNPFLKKDIQGVISLVSPYIPLIGLFGGAATTGKHIYHHKTQPKVPKVSAPGDTSPPVENMQIQSDSKAAQSDS